MEYTEMRTNYWLQLDDKYYQGISANIFNMGTKEAPNYMVTLTIILTPNE